MKNTRFHWMGEIPSHWKLIKLGYLCSLKGRIGWKGLRSDEFLEDSYAYLVTGQDFAGDTVNWAACYQIEKGRYDEDPYIQLKKGDLLVTKDGTIGKIAKVHKLDKPACLNSGIFVLRQTANKFDQSYLYWQLNSSLLTDYNIFVNSGASTIQHLYQNVFERMPLIVPPLSEQKAIADFLDTKCAEIDGLLADLDAEVNTLTEYKKSIIAETVTRGLNPNAPMKSSGIPWAKTIPAHWKVEKFRYKLKPKKIVGQGDKEVLSVYREYGVVIKSSRDDNHNRTSEDTSNYKYVQPNDFVINKMKAWQGSMGVSNYEGIVSPAYFVYSFRDEDYLPKFFHYYMRNANNIPEYRRLSGGIREGQWDLSPYDLGNMPIILPPMDEQIEIANYLDSKCAAIDQAITDKTQQIETLKAYKSSLIYEYVTGKKQVL